MRAMLRLMGRPNPSPDVGAMTYEEARELARHPDATVRRHLAARQDIRPEILYYLAADAATDVRLEIVSNAATPAHAHLILARDGDERVRCELAGKIARLLPDMPADVHDKLRDITIQVLEVLARDQLSLVRQTIAETLKDVANVPAHVIRWLAQDVDPAVSAPVLQFSPLLTDNDLVEIIESAPVQGALAAIARRHGLSASLCDAVVTTDDVEAIADLLGNSSAQVREETLDYIVERSREVTVWQGPLARRPCLPRRTVHKLTEFVADSLLSVLAQRSDMPRDVLKEISGVVHQRLAEGVSAASVATASAAAAPASVAPASVAPASVAPVTAILKPDEGEQEGGTLDRTALHEKGVRLYVQQLYAKGELDEGAIEEALSLGNEEFVTLALAFKAGVAPTLVSRVIAARSAKGVTALACKAGLNMVFAIKLQTQLAHVRPADVLQAKDGADYPFGRDEMNRLINSFIE